jgi:putative ATPase
MKTITITKKLLEQVFQSSSILYDKNGEEHYNVISAFIKSMRASDVNAALYWLARMIEAGEDPKFIARRCIIFASEDIGNASPNALLLANTAFEAVSKVGWPESRIILSQVVIYLAKAPRDNTACTAISKAQEDARETMNLPVPMHLRNAPTKLMKDLDYGKNYIYDHDVKGKKSGQQCLPDELVGKSYL